MKTVLFVAICLFASLTNRAQEFKFEKIIESGKNKTELYSNTKMFVADCWSSAQDVVQNQDDTAHTIQIKATQLFGSKASMGFGNIYIYKYTVKFQAKDNKCRIQIYDIECTDAYQYGLGTEVKIPKIQPCTGDNPNQTTKKMGKGISKKKAVELMQDLKAFFNSIIGSYEKQLEEIADDNW